VARRAAKIKIKYRVSAPLGMEWITQRPHRLSPARMVLTSLLMPLICPGCLPATLGAARGPLMNDDDGGWRMRRSARVMAVMAAAAVSVLVFAGTAQAATVTALYQMSDPTKLVDSSGNNNNGTATRVTRVSTPWGSGYHFNGKDSVASVRDSATLDPGKANLRVTAKVRFTVSPSASVGDYDLVRKGLAGAAGGDWKMEIYPPYKNGPGTAYCQFQDSTKKSASIRDSRNLADGAWHTITCVKTASQIQVIVDGTTRSRSVALGSISNSSALTIGAKPGGGDRYLGDMDEVAIAIG
jgi:hypothetical protein